MLFYVLGMGAFNIYQDQNLLVKIDNAIVSIQDPTDSFDITEAPLYIQDGIYVHTQMSKSIAMNVVDLMFEDMLTSVRVGNSANVKMEDAPVTNYFLDKPPRLISEICDSS
jgi:hypothetical protein